MDGNIFAVIFPPVITTIGVIVSALISRPKHSEFSSREGVRRKTEGQESGGVQVEVGYSKSVILGVIGFVAWFLPIVGLPLSLVGIGMGVADVSKQPQKRLSTLGIYLNIVALIAATANSAIGAYLGYTGQYF